MEEAAELGAEVFMAGPHRTKTLIARENRWRKESSVWCRMPSPVGVKLGIEPLHPMYTAERSVVVTLVQAIDLAEPYSAEDVGVIIDVFHV